LAKGELMKHARLTLICLIFLSLAGCSGQIDSEAFRICRTAIPALVNDAASVRVASVVAGKERKGDILIVYRVSEPGKGTQFRTILCRFATQDITSGKPQLLGIATERGPMPDTSFFFLKRFHLDDPEAALSDPGLGDTEATGWALPFSVAYALQQAVAALPMAAIYGLLAAAYAVVFGLVGRLHLGFGEMAAFGGTATALGATIAVAGGWTAPLGALAFGIMVAIAAGAWHGLVAGRLLIGPLTKASGQQVLIATTGIAIALSEYIRIAQGTTTRWLSPVWNNPSTIARAESFSVTVTPIALLVAGVGVLVATALLGVMKFTRFGREWRAYADDPLAAGLFGVDGRTLLDASVALACALSGLAGGLVTALHGGIGFAGGFTLGLKALIAAVIGGIGSVPGAFLGGLLIAMVEAGWSAFGPIENRDLALYALLVAFLIWRPAGLMGQREHLFGGR
jgi:branched-chain amino acid transport system permease protein